MVGERPTVSMSSTYLTYQLIQNLIRYVSLLDLDPKSRETSEKDIIVLVLLLLRTKDIGFGITLIPIDLRDAGDNRSMEEK